MGWVTALLGSTLQSPDNTGMNPSQGPRGPGAMQTMMQAAQPNIALGWMRGGLGNAGLGALGGQIPGDVSILPPTGTDGLQKDILAQQNAAQEKQTDPSSISNVIDSLLGSTLRGPSSAPGVGGAGPRGSMGVSSKLQVDPATGQLKWVTM